MGRGEATSSSRNSNLNPSGHLVKSNDVSRDVSVRSNNTKAHKMGYAE